MKGHGMKRKAETEKPGSGFLVAEWCAVRYERPAADGRPGRTSEALVIYGGSSDDGVLGVRFDGRGDEVRVSAIAHEDIELQSCHVGFSRAFSRDERILLNGYQSWTDTSELAPNARMYGLSRVPKPVVDRWVLDGGGDYGFTGYTGKPGQLHGFTYLDIRTGERHELLASLCEDDGFTTIYVDAPDASVIADKECPAGIVRAGEEITLCRMALLAGDAGTVYDRWFDLAGTRALPAAPLAGYSSWYRHYGDIDVAKLTSDLEGARRAMNCVDCGGVRKVFQIDDGYCTVGDWLEPHRDRFPNGMAPLAKRIVEADFIPGIWVAPFVCERSSRVAADHPDWLLRDAGGDPVRTGSQWSGGLALDTLNPHVREHVRELLRTITHEWGFRLVKADFLYAACKMAHGGKNRGQLMADAMELLRDAVGPGVALLGCGVPLASAFGRVEYCRVGCDVGLDWDGAPPMRLLHRERVSTRNSMADTVYRAPLDGRAFANDPDVFFLRDDVRLSPKHKEQLLSVDAAYGSMLLTSDDMGSWDASQNALFQAAIDVLRDRKGRR